MDAELSSAIWRNLPDNVLYTIARHALPHLVRSDASTAEQVQLRTAYALICKPFGYAVSELSWGELTVRRGTASTAEQWAALCSHNFTALRLEGPHTQPGAALTLQRDSMARAAASNQLRAIRGAFPHELSPAFFTELEHYSSLEALELRFLPPAEARRVAQAAGPPAPIGSIWRLGSLQHLSLLDVHTEQLDRDLMLPGALMELELRVAGAGGDLPLQLPRLHMGHYAWPFLQRLKLSRSAPGSITVLASSLLQRAGHIEVQGDLRLELSDELRLELSDLQGATASRLVDTLVRLC